MQLLPIQNSFAAGVLSPLMWARSDTEGYQQGVAALLNMNPKAQGPAVSRAGADHVDNIAASYGRSFSFSISRLRSFSVLVLSDGNLYVFDQNGRTGGTDLESNGRFLAGNANWAITETGRGRVDIRSGYCSLITELASDAAQIAQTVTVTSGVLTAIRLFSDIAENGNQVRIKVGTAAGLGDYVDEVTGAAETLHTFTPTATTVYVTILKDPTTTTGTRKIESVSVMAVSDLTVNTSFAHPWNNTEIAQVHYATPPGGLYMIFTTPTTQPWVLTYVPSTDTWTFAVVSFGATAPAAWAGSNWPPTCAFHEGRSWWGGAANSPETFNGSVSGSFFDLTVGSLPANGIEYTIAEQGAIKWMVSSKNLLMGTETAEHIVTSEGYIIIPGDIIVEQQSAYGSSGVQPVKVGNQVLFISPDGRKVREMSYKWTEAGWFTRDLTFTAEHLTKSEKIIELAWAQNPNNLVLCVSDAGNAITCSYDSANNIIGWTLYNFGGTVSSVCSTPLYGSDAVWILARREVSGTINMVLAILDADTLLDFSVIQYHDTASDAVTGVTLLAGVEVSVKVDGALHPKVTLDASGNATLDYVGNKVEIGLAFTQQLVTLPHDKGAKAGSAMSLVKRFNKIWLRLLESAIPTINGQQPPPRSPEDLMDTAIPIAQFQDVMVTNLGFDRNAQIIITQELPLPCNVVGIFGQMSQS